MRFQVPALLCACAALVGGGCGEDPEAAEKDAIRDALRQLDEANEACDGAAAVAVMSSAGLAEYDRLVTLALDGTKVEVQSLSPSEMWQVVQLRHRLTRQQLEKMDGRAYQEFATSDCWYVTDGESSYEDGLGEIDVQGDMAYAEILDEYGNPSGLMGEFAREDGAWKVNEFTFTRLFDELLRSEAAKVNSTVEDYVVLWETLESGKQVRKSVWDPMR